MLSFLLQIYLLNPYEQREFTFLVVYNSFLRIINRAIKGAIGFLA